LAGTWATSDLAAGIRPVATWKSTEAAPTPISVGPSVVPSALSPWQLEQLRRNSERPSSTCEVLLVAAASACGVGAIAA
jgi:hypothetical protein